MLEEIFEDEAIDFGVLNDASYDFTYHVIKEGKVIYSEDEGKRVDFEPLRREYFSFLKKRTLEGRLGVREREDLFKI